MDRMKAYNDWYPESSGYTTFELLEEGVDGLFEILQRNCLEKQQVNKLKKKGEKNDRMESL